MDWSATLTDLEPLLVLLGTVLAAIIAGLFALRSKIQSKAWEELFLQKKKEIEAFIVLLGDFGHRVNILGEVRETAGDLWARQGRSLDFLGGATLGKGTKGFRERHVPRPVQPIAYAFSRG